MNIQDWQKQSDEARLKDQTVLHNRLKALESNLDSLKEMLSKSFLLPYPFLIINMSLDLLDAQRCSQEELMVSLQRILNEHPEGDQERSFFLRSLLYLSAASGRKIQRENWMITSFDIELGPEIGSGG